MRTSDDEDNQIGDYALAFGGFNENGEVTVI